MRKPLVVVCAAVALLLAGGIATTAGADETPDVPGLPGFTIPGLSALPDFGTADDQSDEPSHGDRADGDQTDGGQTDDGRAVDAQADDDQAGNDQAGNDQAGNDQAGNDQAGSDQADSDQVGDDQRNADDQGDTPQRPGGQQAPQRPGGQAARPAQQTRPGDQPAADRSTPQRAAQPARQRPAGKDKADDQPTVRERPMLAQQAAGGSLAAAARENVSTADVSSSPSAPVQQQVLYLVNQNRRRGGCGGLTLDRRLIEAANEHAADMARHDYFAHESRNGDRAGDRVRETGYHWRRYGENIARGADSPWEVVDGWMHSPEHRENIMDCQLHEMGIGLALDGDHTPYWVQDFATPQ
jgi:uncharacterized protein YkwD